ncbi:hypothetical protein [Rhizobium favelukesii]|uniref:Uncharacterized protein n=1 Tax=Rhizobium favelukesii TaxID=348824 RepID=W6R913_9HYPH|nr:hypothetical protein [Rhizobium favelukesii]MCS0459289.1 hypothetical protein [Rhizobium favelukesii]CDM57409.1 putative predicted protein [Rhizobium favelukesii]
MTNTATDKPAEADKPTTLYNVTIEDNLTVPVGAHSLTTTAEGFLFFYVAGELSDIFAPGHWSRVKRAVTA